MGLLSFLKKGEKRDAGGFVSPDDLELPPPPQLGGMSAELPSFSGPRMASVQMPAPVQAQPVLPELKPDAGEPRLPEFKASGFDFSKDFPPIDEGLPKAAAFDQGIQHAPPEPDVPPSFPESGMHAGHSSLLVAEKPVFVRAHEFRQLVEDIGTIVSHPVHAEGADFSRFKASEDAEYERLGGLLEDVQRDLMFVDKTLFEV